MNTKSLLTKVVLTAGTVGVLAGAGAAGASTLPATRGEITAVTHISHRYDNGGGGRWAVDKFGRTLTIDYLGKSTDPAMAATPYMYTASVSDTGTFANIPLALAPNQGGSHLGQVMKPNQVTGTMNGYGQFSLFYASAKDARGLVPRALTSFTVNANPAYASPVWPELAFPAGTTFAQVNETAYGYDYNVPALKVVTTDRHGVKHTHILRAQDWKDTAFNGDGQAQRDGQITGR